MEAGLLTKPSRFTLDLTTNLTVSNRFQPLYSDWNLPDPGGQGHCSDSQSHNDHPFVRKDLFLDDIEKRVPYPGEGFGGTLATPRFNDGSFGPPIHEIKDPSGKVSPRYGESGTGRLGAGVYMIRHADHDRTVTPEGFRIPRILQGPLAYSWEEMNPERMARCKALHELLASDYEGLTIRPRVETHEVVRCSVPPSSYNPCEAGDELSVEEAWRREWGPFDIWSEDPDFTFDQSNIFDVPGMEPSLTVGSTVPTETLSTVGVESNADSSIGSQKFFRRVQPEENVFPVAWENKPISRKGEFGNRPQKTWGRDRLRKRGHVDYREVLSDSQEGTSNGNHLPHSALGSVETSSSFENG